MDSRKVKLAALAVLGVSTLGFFFGGFLPFPLFVKLFIGAFGFGSGFVLLIVSNILKVKQQEGDYKEMYEAELPPANPDDEDDKAGT